MNIKVRQIGKEVCCSFCGYDARIVEPHRYTAEDKRRQTIYDTSRDVTQQLTILSGFTPPLLQRVGFSRVIAMIVLLFPLLVFSQTVRWIYGIDGPGTANSIVYGADGNIYAAGGSPGVSSPEDFTVVSLTSSSGDERWVYKYDGPANDIDVAYSICYGADGNIYAAGHTEDTDGRLYLTVISLDTSGNVRWVYRSSVIGDGVPPTTKAVVVYGADNNIYAIGYRLGGYAAIVSLTLSGAENWVFQRYATVFYSIVYGADGNLYATGEIVVPPSYQNRDFAVVSVTTSGSERWCYQYDVGDRDMGKSIVYGLDGNLYAAGRTGSSESFDFTVLSVDTSGAERWVNTLNWGSEDIAHSICYGTDGNIYAAGGLGYKWSIASFTLSGDTNWIYGPAGEDGCAFSIVYGSDRTIYSTGYSERAPWLPDFTIISVDQSGTENWVYRDSEGWGRSVIYGSDGNIYAAGQGRDEYTGEGFTIISLAPDASIEESDVILDNSVALSILPNPSNGQIKIRFSSPGESEAKVMIYDVSGRLCYQAKRKVRIQDNEIRITPVLKDGIYFLTLDTDNILTAKKLVITNRGD